MEKLPFSQLLVPILLTFVHLSASQKQCTSPPAVRAGFWLSNSNHYSSLSNVSSSLYTHLHYYSLSINETTFTVSVPPQDQLPLLVNFSACVKSDNPSIKTLLSIATDDHRINSSNAAFSTMVADKTLRSAFISSTIELANGHGFDGLDLAWQFPSSMSDMANLALLLSEWRAAVNNTAEDSSPSLLLTATVYFSGHVFDGPTDDLDYPASAISENLDWVNALCFGYHKTNELITAADAPLYDKTTHLSTSYCIESWLDAGIPPCKLVMGIPLFGRSWYLKNKEKNGLGAQAVAAGPREKLSNRTGVIAYFEIKQILKETTPSLSYDNRTVSSYFHNGGLWVSFDSLQVVDEKIKFSLRNKLLGYFLWPISFDDSNHTISKKASGAWQIASASGEGKLGYEEAPSPQELNAQDLAPTQQEDISDAIARDPLMILYICNSLFLLLNLVRI
ncbi:chitinase-3-like protein 1 isoform X1 [Asparagus officinalis]|uniref:chitinase-3-like protein 1 isoform X1 n=1 Tax=Asparagus officinalis TaxID=4686 RepID=UPI00098E7889|nr:chitinase-3-like protein 1 isoform X1 [Asparagus officinalis]